MHVIVFMWPRPKIAKNWATKCWATTYNYVIYRIKTVRLPQNQVCVSMISTYHQTLQVICSFWLSREVSLNKLHLAEPTNKDVQVAKGLGKHSDRQQATVVSSHVSLSVVHYGEYGK